MRKELNTRFNGQDTRKVGTANPTVTSGAAIAHACLPSVRLKGWPKSRCELLLNTPEDADAKSKSRALELVSFMARVKKGVTRSFRGKKLRKGPGNFLKIKNRAGACPPLPTGQNLVHAMPSGRSCPSGKKKALCTRGCQREVHWFLKSALLLLLLCCGNRRTAAAAVVCRIARALATKKIWGATDRHEQLHHGRVNKMCTGD